MEPDHAAAKIRRANIENAEAPKPRAGEHTKGPWRTQDALVFFPDSAGGFSLQNCPAPEANARRIVACVNYCDGMPTEHIESSTIGHQGLQAERDLLRERERELIAALEGLIGKIEVMNGCNPYDFDEGAENEWPEFQLARTLLAKHGR